MHLAQAPSDLTALIPLQSETPNLSFDALQLLVSATVQPNGEYHPKTIDFCKELRSHGLLFVCCLSAACFS